MIGTGRGERREWQRFPCDLRVTGHSYFNLQEILWEGRGVDVSRGGVRVEVRREFDLAAALNLQVRRPGGTEAVTRLARVVHAEPQADGVWSIGCRFTTELSEPELSQLLRP